MSASSKLFQFGKQHIARGIGRSTELVIERAQGAYVWTVDGKKYLDLTTGIGVTSTGKRVLSCSMNGSVITDDGDHRSLSPQGCQGCTGTSCQLVPWSSQHLHAQAYARFDREASTQDALS